MTNVEQHGFEGKASVQKQKMKPQPSEILNGGDPDRISDTIESNGQSPSTGSSKTIKSGKENTLKSAQSRNEVDSWITPKRYARTSVHFLSLYPKNFQNILRFCFFNEKGMLKQYKQNMG
jgi:hypothetical protein